LRILDRHIRRAVLGSTLLVLLTLIALAAFLTVLEELDDVGEGGYGLGQVFVYTVLTLPALAAEMFPAASLLGSLLGLGAIANQNELIVMRASGVSVFRIVASVLKAGMIVAALSVVVGEGIAPASDQLAHRKRAVAKSGHITLHTDHGFWARDGDKFINIRDVLTDGRLRFIFIYDFNEEGVLQSATLVNGASLQDGVWRLEGIGQSSPTEHGVTTRWIPDGEWQALLDPRLISLIGVSPDKLSVWGLHQYASFLRSEGLHAQPYELAFWSKVTAPFSTLTMILVALPFVLGPLRGVGIGQRIMMGALIGIGFSLFNRIFSNLGLVYVLDPLFSAVLPTAVVLVITLAALRRRS
jgi:lipopolysaccharide export system permease protein